LRVTDQIIDGTANRFLWFYPVNDAWNITRFAITDDRVRPLCQHCSRALEERQKSYSEEEGQKVDAAAPSTRRVDLTVPIGYYFVPDSAMKTASDLSSSISVLG